MIVDLQNKIGAAGKQIGNIGGRLKRNRTRASNRLDRAREEIRACRSTDSRSPYRVGGRCPLCLRKELRDGLLSDCRAGYRWRARSAIARRRGDNEALVKIRAIGGDGTEIGGLRLRDPAYRVANHREIAARAARAQVAGRRAGVGPAGECGDLFSRELSFVLEARLGGQPRRHVALCCDGGDELRAFGGVLVGEQAEGRDAGRAVAGDAVE